jgi:hypothetical protein
MPASYTMLRLNPVTRGVLRIDRLMALRDSARWKVLVDSVRLALTAKRVERLPCDTSATGFPIAEAWRFGAPVRPAFSVIDCATPALRGTVCEWRSMRSSGVDPKPSHE